MGEGFVRRRGTGDPPSGAPATRVHLDLGDLPVAQLVHDLRNALTVMIACSDNIAGLVPEGQADQDLAELRRCASWALTLTRELLTAARTSGARGIVELNGVVAGMAETLARIMGRIGLSLQLSDEPVPVVADPSDVERILLNLALNARDAMAGRGVLTIRTAIAQGSSASLIDGIRLAPSARITVSDTGCGLTPEVRQRMFDPFFTTKRSGTGLGLSSLAFTVGQLQGTVVVESQAGRGTSVSVVLPLATQHDRK